MTLRLTLAGAAFAALLAACNAEAPDTAATPSEVETAAAPAEEHGAAVAANPSSQEIIETRQKHLKEMGAAMKTIGDNLKSGSPSLETIRPAVATLNGHAPNLASWFPAGAGPEAGVKTEALAKIWEDAPGFQAAAKRYVGEAAKLQTIADAGDLQAIGPQLGAVGAACKNCHDTYRLKKE